jgi:hypothetical protein
MIFIDAKPFILPQKIVIKTIPTPVGVKDMLAGADVLANLQFGANPLVLSTISVSGIGDIRDTESDFKLITDRFDLDILHTIHDDIQDLTFTGIFIKLVSSMSVENPYIIQWETVMMGSPNRQVIKEWGT